MIGKNLFGRRKQSPSDAIQKIHLIVSRLIRVEIFQRLSIAKEILCSHLSRETDRDEAFISTR